MKKLGLALVLSIMLASSLAFAVSATPLRNDAAYIKESTSTNWSGYAVYTTSGAVTDVKGQWVITKAVGSVTPNAYSAFWVGIDGYNSNSVEQIGTSEDTSGGTASYYAWYEMYPKYPVTINMKISVGDKMSAEVKYQGSGRFWLYITDLTTGASYSTTQRYTRAARSSAEWVAEAPSSSRGVLPLTDFGTASFSSSYATVNGVTGSINHSGWSFDAINMVTSSGALKAQTSALSTDGTSFSVTWISAGP